MKKALLITSMIFLALVLAQVSFVSAQDELSLDPPGCCVMVGCCIQGDQGCTYDQKCTYWDMSGWDFGKQFCTYIQLQGYAQETQWFDESCAGVLTNETAVAQLPQGCTDGWDIPEFSTVAAGIAIAGAIAGFVFLRKKSDRK